MKKKSNIILLLVIGMCVLFVGGFYGTKFIMEKNILSKKVSNDALVKQQEKEDPVKQGVKDMKEIFKPEIAFTSNDMDTIDTFIDEYKNEDLVKNDLVNFLIEKAQECLKDDIDINSDIFSKTSYAFERLFIDYPENETIINLRDKLSEKESKNSPLDNPVNNTTETNNTSTPAKLTSYDGMLELENNYPENDYVCGTIKNLSNRPYSYVQVNVNLYDENGNQIDSTFANVANLEEYGTWHFEAIVINSKRVSKYRIISIEGMR